MVPTVLAQRIEHWPLERLIPYINNPRIHSDVQIAQIAASIREFGFTNPILVDTNQGIMAGHGRLLCQGFGDSWDRGWLGVIVSEDSADEKQMKSG